MTEERQNIVEWAFAHRIFSLPTAVLDASAIETINRINLGLRGKEGQLACLTTDQTGLHIQLTDVLLSPTEVHGLANELPKYPYLRELRLCGQTFEF